MIWERIVNGIDLRIGEKLLVRSIRTGNAQRVGCLLGLIERARRDGDDLDELAVLHRGNDFAGRDFRDTWRTPQRIFFFMTRCDLARGLRRHGSSSLPPPERDVFSKRGFAHYVFFRLSVIDEGHTAVARHAIALVIGVARTVALAVLLAPKALSAGSDTSFHAVNTGRLDLRRERNFPRTNHEHGTGRHPHDPFGDGTEQHAREPLSTMRPDNHEMRLEIAGEFGNLFGGGIEAQVRNDPLRNRHGWVAPTREIIESAIEILLDLTFRFARRRRGRHRLGHVLEAHHRRERRRHVNGVELRVSNAACELERLNERKLARLGVVHPYDDDLRTGVGFHCASRLLLTSCRVRASTTSALEAACDGGEWHFVSLLMGGIVVR